jgi:pyruvate-ferredoxin/flavodoxin oxidoreductase
MAAPGETLDGNEAVARTAYRLSEVIAIYPITPASTMAEWCDQWATEHRPNLEGVVPDVIEMQSEAGAAGTLHGAATRGAMATTFTASQGLLLMMPNMFKMAGELMPAVIHVAARAVATHALSIFGDHSDVMAVRSTGWAMLSAGSVQEAADFALISHAATLTSRVPFLHFFDGFRTSHEVATVVVPTDNDLRALVDAEAVSALRNRGLDPDHPQLRGSAQNPDVFFQAREAINPFVDAVPAVVQTAFDKLAARTGRRYGLVDYEGASDADRVIVVMGSAVGAISEAVEALNTLGQKVGLVQVHLYRPFPVDAFLRALPPTVTRVAVLDRTKEPGATADPLHLDVLSALIDSGRPMPVVTGGRYGLASKEFTPAMAKAVFDDLDTAKPKRRFTVGITDDVSHTSLAVDTTFQTDHADLRAVFFGLGSDGTVGANKATAKIVGDVSGRYAQGYFVYDSKKSGSMTVSHLRFADRPIRSTYLVSDAHFVACHQIGLLDRVDVLSVARPGGTFLLNSPHAPEATWDRLPADAQHHIIDKKLRVHIIDGHRVASEVGLPGLISTVMQAAFFVVTDVIPSVDALDALKNSLSKTYGLLGPRIVEANLAAVDLAAGRLSELTIPTVATGRPRRAPVPAGASDFVQRVTGRMLAGEGDLLPVSAMPVDGVFPTGTARVEKRRLATELPVWDPDICIDCARCTLVCPHAAIRLKIHEEPALVGAPEGFLSKVFRSHDHPGLRLTIQVAPEDCTGCGVCVDVCPARSKTQVKHKALDMVPIPDLIDTVIANWNWFLGMAGVEPGVLDPATVKGSQSREPLFEFSGACAGCGETPYLKLLTQMFGDRTVVANATGCSSIYGGNLPTTPWAANADGRGPAWSNSLFEDNAEFGLGMRLALNRQNAVARRTLAALAAISPDIPPTVVEPLLGIDPGQAVDDVTLNEQRRLTGQLDDVLSRLVTRTDEHGVLARRLRPLIGSLSRRNVWIVGGDGWAYDIGAGGLDHVLGSGLDVNILVLDTEVYSNTGGQASKSTPRGAVAKFAAGGKRTAKKDLGVEARRYGNVYVAQIAIGANDVQAVKAFAEAEAWPGPSLIIAYSTCIAHGIDMRTSMTHQKDAVKSGYWPLYRYVPGEEEHGTPFQLDSKPPSIPVEVFLSAETRFATLRRSDPVAATELAGLAQQDINERWRYYEQLAHMERRVPGGFHGDGRRPLASASPPAAALESATPESEATQP